MDGTTTHTWPQRCFTPGSTPTPRGRVVRRILSTVAFAWLAVSCGGSDATTSTTTTTTSTTIPPAIPRLTPLTELQVGMCFDRPPEGNDRRFIALVVDCAALHTYEIYAASVYVDDNGNGSYPSEDTVRSAAEDECFNSFESYLGEPWVSSPYELHTFWPTEQSWAEGDRKLLCAVTPSDKAPRAGSAIVSGAAVNPGATGSGSGSTTAGATQPSG